MAYDIEQLREKTPLTKDEAAVIAGVALDDLYRTMNEAALKSPSRGRRSTDGRLELVAEWDRLYPRVAVKTLELMAVARHLRHPGTGPSAPPGSS